MMMNSRLRNRTTFTGKKEVVKQPSSGSMAKTTSMGMVSKKTVKIPEGVESEEEDVVSSDDAIFQNE